MREFWRDHGTDHITPKGLDCPEGWDVGAHLTSMVKGSDLLDFGCGRGRLSGAFEPDSYTGYDINPTALRVAQQAHPAHRFTGLCPLRADVVLLYTVALHMTDDELRGVIAGIDSPRWIIAEVMGRKWRNSKSTPPAFNREPEEYMAMFPGWNVDAHSYPYAHYSDGALTILDFSC